MLNSVEQFFLHVYDHVVTLWLYAVIFDGYYAYGERLTPWLHYLHG